MSTEELQLVLTMVEQAGEGAFALACIYLVVGFFKAMLSPVVWLVFFVLAYRGGRHIFDQYQAVSPVDKIKARVEAHLNWSRQQYPQLTKSAVEDFVKGHADKVEL